MNFCFIKKIWILCFFLLMGDLMVPVFVFCSFLGFDNIFDGQIWEKLHEMANVSCLVKSLYIWSHSLALTERGTEIFWVRSEEAQESFQCRAERRYITASTIPVAGPSGTPCRLPANAASCRLPANAASPRCQFLWRWAFSCAARQSHDTHKRFEFFAEIQQN